MDFLPKITKYNAYFVIIQTEQALTGNAIAMFCLYYVKSRIHR